MVKKTTLFGLSFVGLILVGCSQEDMFIENPDLDNASKHLTSYKIPSDVAVEQALGFVSALEPSTRSNERVVSEINLIGDNMQTRSGEKLDSLLYLINFADNEGFVLMSADVRSIPIYAISDKGNFVIDESNKEQMNSIIEGAKQDVIASTKSNTAPPLDANLEGLYPWPFFEGWFNTPINFKIAPKLSEFQSRVSGFGEFAQYCRNEKGEPALSGCVGVGTEQILSYYQHPTHIDGYFISWEKANSNDGTKTVARVLQLIGSKKYLNLHYTDMGNLATGYHSNILSAMNKLGYQHHGSFVDFFKNEQTAVDALDEGPILMQAYSKKFEGKGHVWVVDGMIQYKVNITGQVSLDGSTERYIYPNLFHCVWGFIDGSCNGYYYADLYGFIGEPCFKDAKDPISNQGSIYAACDTEVKFLYGFRPLR